MWLPFRGQLLPPTFREVDPRQPTSRSGRPADLAQILRQPLRRISSFLDLIYTLLLLKWSNEGEDNPQQKQKKDHRRKSDRR